MSTEPTKAAIEAAARELHHTMEGDQTVPYPWESLSEVERGDYRDWTRIILRAAQAATPEAVPTGRTKTATDSVGEQHIVPVRRTQPEPEGEVVERRSGYIAADRAVRNQVEEVCCQKWCSTEAEVAADVARWHALGFLDVRALQFDITVRRLPTVATTTADVGDAT